MEPDLTLESESEQDTTAIAAAFGKVLNGGEFVSLEGDLGAGKTFFARAIARSLGVHSNVTSPTFVIQKIYDVPQPVNVSRIAHYDFYRLGSYGELVDIGFEDSGEDTLVLAEWGDRFSSHFPRKPIRVKLQTLENDHRLLEFFSLGVNRIENLKQHLGQAGKP